MKRTVQTGLMLLLIVKSVFACSFPAGFEPVSAFAGNETLYKAMFFGSFVLFIPIVAICIFRRFHGVWSPLTAFGSLVLFIPAILAANVMSPCSDVFMSRVIIGETFIMSLLFTISFSSWISSRKPARGTP